MFQIWPGHETFHFLLHSYAVYIVFVLMAYVFEMMTVMWRYHRIHVPFNLHLLTIHHPFQDVQCQPLAPLLGRCGLICVGRSRDEAEQLFERVKERGTHSSISPTCKVLEIHIVTVYVNPSKTTSCVISVPSNTVYVCVGCIFPLHNHDHLQSFTYCTTCNTFRAFLTVWFCRMFVQ